jgi:UDP-glucose 4-epimerase
MSQGEPGKARVRKPRRPRGEVVAFPPAARKPKVAITGGAGFLGSRLVKAMALQGDWDIVVLDLAPASNVPVEVRHRFLDLNLPHADGTVYRILKDEAPDAVVHLAAIRSPSLDTTYTHELNSLGALHVLAAAGEAKVPKIVMGSTTMVYGARGDNPNFLTEEHRLRADAQDRFVMDFVEAEKHARDHQRNYPECNVSVLRFAQIHAPEVRDYKAKYFESFFAVTMLGYDPLIQVLHPEDATSALLKAVTLTETRGVFNIAPEGILPLSSILLLYGALPVPVPHPLAYPLIEAAWLAGLALAPGIHAHYLRYLCVASNDKARNVLEWAPAWTTLDSVLESAQTHRGEGRVLDWGALQEAARRAAYRYEQRVHRARREPAGPASHPRPAPRKEAAS